MNTARSVAETALIVVDRVLAVKPGEQFLIITNPSGDVYEISLALYHAALELGAEATIVVQPEKTQLDFANRAALAAFGSNPGICASISARKVTACRRSWTGAPRARAFSRGACRRGAPRCPN